MESALLGTNIFRPPRLALFNIIFFRPPMVKLTAWIGDNVSFFLFSFLSLGIQSPSENGNGT